MSKIFPMKLRRADRRGPEPVQHDDHVNRWLARYVAPEHISRMPAPYLAADFAKPKRVPAPPPDKSAIALHQLRNMAAHGMESWHANMLKLLAPPNSGLFLGALICARVYANATMSSSEWKRWRDLEKKLSPEHKAELATIQHARGLKLRRAARIIREDLPPQWRARYAEGLSTYRAVCRAKRQTR